MIEIRGETRKKMERELPRMAVVAGEMLGISNETLSQILALPDGYLQRIRERKLTVQKGTEAYERCVLMTGLVSMLWSLHGPDGNSIQHWLHTKNEDLRAKPVNLLLRTDGFKMVIAHLEARMASRSIH